MSDIKAVVRIEHPDIVLTETVVYDSSATVTSVSEAGTDPQSGRFLYHVESPDFEYTDEAKTISPVISNANGVVLDMENDGNAWLITVWMPDRGKLVDLWDYAEANGVEIDLLQVNEYASVIETAAGLTDNQREALLFALDAGYFEEPRDVTLGEVAAGLGISQPAASGLLRRGIKRLVVSSLVDEE